MPATSCSSLRDGDPFEVCLPSLMALGNTATGAGHRPNLITSACRRVQMTSESCARCGAARLPVPDNVEQYCKTKDCARARRHSPKDPVSPNAIYGHPD